MEKNIGKNTIGDNNKMSVDLKTYNMSTHDLSTVVRNTQAPGTLVPNLTLLVQKGDIIDIDILAEALSIASISSKNTSRLFFILPLFLPASNATVSLLIFEFIGTFIGLFFINLSRA